MFKSERVTPATVEFVDIAGLVKGASKGEGLGNRFLSHIREVDAIVHVVRCFSDSNIAHVDGSLFPSRDVETINLELIFADLEVLERRIEKAKKMLKGDRKYLSEVELYERIKEGLEAGTPVRAMTFTEEEKKLADHLFLLPQNPCCTLQIFQKMICSPAKTPMSGNSGGSAAGKVRKWS